jgi:hypothetical protein
MLQTPIAAATARIVSVDGQPYELRACVGNAPKRGIYVEGNEANDNALPQGFLVTQPPFSVTRPHFHETNQFQVFVSGSGAFGKKPAAPLTVQFAAGHTPYGPIKAGAGGIMYFTLRQCWDPGAKYMPQMRDKLERGNQRQRLVVAPDLLSRAALQNTGDVQFDTLLPDEADGLMAGLWTLGPNSHAELPDANGGGGQYHVVVNGVLEGMLESTGRAPERLPRWSCQYAFPGDGCVSLRTNDAGAQVLVLRFPTLD